MKLKWTSKLVWAIGVVLIAVFFVGYLINYQYEKRIGSYMLNAKDMNAPDKMLEQLESAKQGMVSEGLTEDMYGALIFKKPDNSMKFQYQHLDSIIERVKAVQEWKERVYETNGTQAESLGDVYEQKMTNLRKFIMEDVRSDWIAHKSWVIKRYPWYYIAMLGNVSPNKGHQISSLSNIAIAIVLLLFLKNYHSKHKKGNKPNTPREAEQSFK